ncbi:MAG: gamma-butyrobetaine hydroxylase-like domain-containing protein [Pseudomonadota bacterium]|nr:gamma-butyrobetaine hydroxylase-like domain-containing protein [Pseudomonadota bacterium]
MKPDKNDDPWPLEIRCNAARDRLTVRFEHHGEIELSAELLRVESPSAEVQGHGPAQKQTPRDKQDVTITKIVPVGSYAVRLVFSDGHDTGIYSWALLQDYGRRQDQLMADYQHRVAGLS